jgi:hypothetical protein
MGKSELDSPVKPSQDEITVRIVTPREPLFGKE